MAIVSIACGIIGSQVLRFPMLVISLWLGLWALLKLMNFERGYFNTPRFIALFLAPLGMVCGIIDLFKLGYILNEAGLDAWLVTTFFW